MHVLAGRQLQHGRVLTFAQMRQQHDLPVRKLKRIMMNVRLVLVDLSEHSHPMPELTPWAEHEDSLALHLLLESKLCAGKQAYGLANRSKPRVIIPGNLVDTSSALLRQKEPREPQ